MIMCAPGGVAYHAITPDRTGNRLRIAFDLSKLVHSRV
jgi:hypothetical protein